MAAHFVRAVVIVSRKKMNSGTQCATGSAAIVLACLDEAARGHEVRRRAKHRARETEDFTLGDRSCRNSNTQCQNT